MVPKMETLRSEQNLEGHQSIPPSSKSSDKQNVPNVGHHLLHEVPLSENSLSLPQASPLPGSTYWALPGLPV